MKKKIILQNIFAHAFSQLISDSICGVHREDAQGCDLAPFFGDLSQSEKLSEIKLPLDQFEVELYEQQLPS